MHLLLYINFMLVFWIIRSYHICFPKPLHNYVPRALIRSTLVTSKNYYLLSEALIKDHREWLLYEFSSRIYVKILWKVNTKEKSETLLKLNLFIRIFQKFPKTNICGTFFTQQLFTEHTFCTFCWIGFEGVLVSFIFPFPFPFMNPFPRIDDSHANESQNLFFTPFLTKTNKIDKITSNVTKRN